jgi:hypothetical protein
VLTVSQIQIHLYFTCKVPVGKGLFIPVSPVEISDKESPGATPEDLRLAAKTDQDSVNSLYLKIGEKEYNYEDLRNYRTNTDVFEVAYADNGLFGVIEGGPSKVAADGYYIMTDPLPKGNHTVHYKSSLSCLDPGCAELSCLTYYSGDDLNPKIPSIWVNLSIDYIKYF